MFRGLCFSDPVKLVRDGQWNERYTFPMLISDWDFTPTTQDRFSKDYLQGKQR